MLNPKGDVVDTKDIESADDAHAWFVDAKADNSELGWRMEVKADDGHWAFRRLGGRPKNSHPSPVTYHFPIGGAWLLVTRRDRGSSTANDG